jgi:hypothetical protein
MAGAALNRRWVRLLLAALALAALLSRMDRAALALALRAFDPVCGLAMAGVFLVTLSLFARRWWVIAAALGVRAPFVRFVRALWISLCAGEFGPPLLVGELARFRLMRDSGEAWPLAASQAVDRLSGNAVLLAIVLGLAPYYQGIYRDFPLPRVAALALVLAAVVAGWVALRRFWPMARSRGKALLALCNPWSAPTHFAYSFLIQWLLSLNFALAALGMGLSREFWAVALAGPLLLLGVGAMPGLVSDWGKREAVAVVLLVPAGLSPEQSLAVSLIYGGLNALTALPGALWWALARRRPSGDAEGG